MRFYKIVIFILLVYWSNISAQTSDTLHYISLDPYYFHLEYLINDSSLMIDVRTPFEFRRNRIKDAINIPSVRDLEIAADTISRICFLFLYCTDDFRSRQAAEHFYKKGFRKIASLEGGLISWRRENMPVDKTRIRRKRR